MKPEALCVGFPKAGTTTLYDILRQHPGIYVSGIKEPLYYSIPSLRKKGFSWYLKRYYAKASAGKRIVEINPTLTKKDYAEEIKCDFGSDLKIIFLLRNPIERLYSDFRMNLIFGCCFSDIVSHLNRDIGELFDEWVQENFQLDDAGNVTIRENHCDFINYGEYQERIDSYRRLYPPQNIKYIFFEEFVKQPQKVCEELFVFLNVERQEDNICFNLKSNEGNRFPRNRFMIKIARLWNRYFWRTLVIPHFFYISDSFSQRMNNMAWSMSELCSIKAKGSVSIHETTREFLKKYYQKEYNYFKNVLNLPVECCWEEFNGLCEDGV